MAITTRVETLVTVRVPGLSGPQARISRMAYLAPRGQDMRSDGISRITASLPLGTFSTRSTSQPRPAYYSGLGPTTVRDGNNSGDLLKISLPCTLGVRRRTNVTAAPQLHQSARLFCGSITLSITSTCLPIRSTITIVIVCLVPIIYLINSG